MLESLRIEGYAIIDRLEIEFHDGLTVLSGETGTGKSILIGALSLVLGAKADSTVIRSGHEETTVTGVIRVDGIDEAISWLSDRGLSPDDGRVIVRRVLKASGRGGFYVQSTPTTRSDVKEFTSLLFDVHGQHEHQSLLQPRTQRELIDRFGGIDGRAARFERLFNDVSAGRAELEGL